MTYSHFQFGMWRSVIVSVDKFTYYWTELVEFPDWPVVLLVKVIVWLLVVFPIFIEPSLILITILGVIFWFWAFAESTKINGIANTTPIMNTLAMTVQTNFIDLLLLWAYIELTRRILYHVRETKLDYFIYVEYKSEAFW